TAVSRVNGGRGGRVAVSSRFLVSRTEVCRSVITSSFSLILVILDVVDYQNLSDCAFVGFCNLKNEVILVPPFDGEMLVHHRIAAWSTRHSGWITVFAKRRTF